MMRQPRIQSASLQSVMVNLSLISEVAWSDSTLESNARRMSLMLVADMENVDGERRV